MLRIIDNVNEQKVIELLQNIKSGIICMLNNYMFLYNDNEVNILKNSLLLVNEQLNRIENGNYIFKDVYSVLLCEDYLKPLVFKCWNFENKNGCQYISWFKNDFLGDIPPVISATFSSSNEDSFCNSRYGINYEVFIDGFLGACNKDAATLIEDSSRNSIYTIGKTADGKVINSYNLATPIITPHQVFDKSSNDYKSKHNEIVLDSRFIKPVSVIYTNDDDLEMVYLISSKYKIPIDFKETIRNI